MKQRLWARGRRDEKRDGDDEQDLAVRELAPAKLTRAAQDALHPEEAGSRRFNEPGKLTRADAGDDQAMTAEEGLAYSSWILGQDRGWREPAVAAPAGRIDRRAEPGKAEIDDEGGLGAAFAFLAETRSGTSLPAELRTRLEDELGVDLGRVRIHTDAAAGGAAAALGARAFTIGDDIYFARGAYDPSGDAGIELIAHECKHVAQTRISGNQAAPGRRVSRPDDGHEREADDFARTFTTRLRQRFDTSDPAELVEHVRQQGEQIGLPHRDELEQHFGETFDYLKVYTGQAAQVACDMMSAGAFAVRNMLAFADATPSRDLVMHELTHIVQMGGRSAARPGGFKPGTVTVGFENSAAEHEAYAASDARPVESADPNTVHRGVTTQPIDRVKAWASGINLKTYDGATRKDMVWAGVKGDNFFPRYTEASEQSYTVTDYKRGNKGAEDSDLSSVHSSGKGKDVGGGKQLHQAGTRWVLTAKTSGKYTENVENIFKKKRGKWKAYSGAYDDSIGLAAIKKYIKVFAWGDDKLDKNDAAVSESEIDAYRREMVERIAGVASFQSETANWSKFYKEVVAANIFRHPYKRIVGNIFEKLVGNSLEKDDDYPVKDQQLVFEFKKGKKNVKAIADGFIIPKNQVGKKSMLAECKAWTKGPGATEREQMRTYNAIIAGSVAYEGKELEVKQHKFTHVVYFFADKKVSKLWSKALKEEFAQKSYYSQVPPPEGQNTFKVKYNPEFELPVDEGQTHVKLNSPAINHPGLDVKSIDAQLDEAGQVKSGTITAGLNAADGAIKNPAKPQKIEAGGQVANKWDGLTSTLSKALGDKIKINAGLDDDGVFATITMEGGGKAMGGFTFKGGSVTLKYTAGNTFEVKGTVGVERKVNKGTISGELTLGYAAGDWSIFGNVSVTEGVVDGLETFEGGFSYEKGKLTLFADTAVITKKFKAITLTGTASNITYDVKAESFSGTATLEADLGQFGKATGSATLTNNKLTRASISYDTPELKYPAKSDKPTFSGTVGGTVTYENGKFGGEIRGTANLNVPALKKVAGEEGVGLKVDAHITPEGGYGGTISTTTPLKFGSHFQIGSMSCKLADDGAISGEFDIEIVKFKYLEQAKIKCAIDKNGFKVTEAKIKVPFGTEGSKLWGSLAVDYVEGKGLTVTGDVSCKIKEGMVAKGTLKYSTETNKVDLKLSVDKIQLLKHGPVEKNLFTFTKQIPLVSIYGLGIYLDLGIDLLFSYEFDLALKPTISLEEMSMETFEYKKISAEIELLGALIAKLTAQPKVGLGIFALSPSLLRGGGGIKIPITGEAALKPKAKLNVSYSPDGGVEGDAQLSMPLTFGIKGAVKPYADLSVLDGAWNPSWTGDALTEFEIMPPKELFNFELDLGGDMSKKDPKIPDKPGAPTAGAGKVLPQEKPVAKEVGGGTADKNAEPASSGPSGEGGGLPDEPLKLSSLLSGLKGLPGYATIEAIMKKAGAAWDAIKGFFGRVAKTFKAWFDAVAGGMEDIIDGFAKEGLGYMPKLIKKLVGSSVWEVIEPIVTALGGVGEKLLEMFETKPPTSLADFFPWALRTAASVWGLAFESITSLVSAVGTMIEKLGGAAKKIITKLVNDGQIGVKRHTYYIWKPIGKNWYFFAATEYKIKVLGADIYFREEGMITDPGSVVGVALYEALDGMGVPSTGGYDDPDVGGNSRDFWA